MTNKYLLKISQQQQDRDDPNHPFRTAATESLASIPADIVGTAAGGAMGTKLFGERSMINFGKTIGSHNIGGMAGAAVGGLLTNYAVLKHQQNARTLK